ncbi:hypothetical protein [Marinomonas foliarum]|uniref:DUF4156 domain-containing protein n=1 Tax=Marinomonas foliarum TaxID=491950 RepID=A0A369ACJ0_9GAMM|nr:hypothetical protein [Marinomonas foliarum]RCX07059.1 hypothetical protein DFP77_107159 [Marinomonas foliarum]
MKKLAFSLIATATLGLAGCQSLGTVTPLQDGYIAEATVENGDTKEAKQIALETAANQCKKYGKEFYVIEESQEESNDYDLDDNTTTLANTASSLLLGKSAFNQTRTVSLKFDCK